MVTIMHPELAGGRGWSSLWGGLRSKYPSTPPVIFWIRGAQGQGCLLSIHCLSVSVLSSSLSLSLSLFLFDNSIWNKKELPQQWKKSIIVSIIQWVIQLTCNYSGTSMLPITYKTLSNILVSKLTPYLGEIIGDDWCGFWCNRSASDHTFCMHEVLEKNGIVRGKYLSYL